MFYQVQSHTVFYKLLSESLSDGLGHVIMDEKHEETRQRIRKVHTGSSSDHILAGLKGFGFGLLGGVTGIFKQPYEGACNDGFQVGHSLPVFA
jgi:vacuolar protein sorting-associated protein 13D